MTKRLYFFALAAVAAAALITTGCDGETDGSGGAGGGAGGEGGGAGGQGGGAGGGGGSGGTGGTAAGGFCGKSCAMPMDCCPMGAMGCPSDMYPNNWTCDSGACGAPQCKVKDDCTFMGALPDYDCLTLDSKKYCFEGCAADADCTAPATCIGSDDNGTKYCTVDSSGGGCMADADCNGYGKCVDKACVCDVDADCTGMGVDKCVK